MNSQHLCLLHSSHIFDLKSQSCSRDSCDQQKKEWIKQKVFGVKHSNETLTFTCPQGLLCNKSRGLIFIQIESVCCFAPVWRVWSSDAGRDSGPFPPIVWDNGMHCIIVLFSCLCFRGWFGSKWKIVKGFSDSLHSPYSKAASELDMCIENYIFRPVESAIGFSMNVYVYQTSQRVQEDHFLMGPPCCGCLLIFSAKTSQ